MKVVKQTAEYTIIQKRNNRYGVRGADRKWINADEKVRILLEQGLIKVTAPAAPAEEATEEAAEEAAPEAAKESVEAVAEESAEQESEEKAAE